jgi:hypothetical protein
MDALSQTLRVVRLTGAIFISARFSAPWCYASPTADSAAPLLEPGAERLVIYHLITEGDCWLEMEGQPPLQVSAGDVLIFPHGAAHRMASTPGVRPGEGRRLADVLARRPRQLAYGGGGAVTRIVCGYMACDARLGRMLLAGLPPVVKVNVRGSPAGAWLESSVGYALAEARSPRPGGAGVLAKLAEVLFIEALRLHMAEAGWPASATAWSGRRSRPCIASRPASGRSKSWRERPAPPARCLPSASSNWSAPRRCSTWRSGACCWPPTCCAPAPRR